MTPLELPLEPGLNTPGKVTVEVDAEMTTVRLELTGEPVSYSRGELELGVGRVDFAIDDAHLRGSALLTTEQTRALWAYLGRELGLVVISE